MEQFREVRQVKKKISLLFCLLTMILVFTGCAKKEEAVEYDKASIEQMIEFLIESCQNMDDESFENWNKGSELQQEFTLLQMGVLFTPESFNSSVESWKAGVEECGEYMGHGDFSYEADADGITVSTLANFAERDAEIVFTFDEKSYLETTTINAKFTLPEILKKAGLNTLLGMGTVFAVLILISFIISLFKYISKFEKGSKKAAEGTKTAAPAAPVAAAKAKETDNLELIAVISAANAAAEGTSTDGFVVRSIRRRPTNKWKA